MADDSPTANVSFKPPLPKYIITADGVPLMTYTANSAQIFCIQE